MYNLTFTGFKTKAQAEAFRDWYSGQGEQDATVWFECRKEEGEIDVDFMPVDVQDPKGHGWKMNTLKCPLKIG